MYTLRVFLKFNARNLTCACQTQVFLFNLTLQMSNKKPKQSRCTGNQSFSHHVFLVVTSSSSLGFPNDFTAWKAALQLRSFHGHFTLMSWGNHQTHGAPSLEVGFEAASPRDSFVHTWVHEAQYLLIFFSKTMMNSLGDHTIYCP